MTFQYRYRKQIIIGIILLCVLLVGIFFLIQYQPKSKKKKPSVVLEEKEISTDEEYYLKVDIKGEVNLPGIYSLKENSRVIDVIDLAGGLTENADTTVINLSKKVFDEMVIIIYNHEQVLKFSETKEVEKIVQKKCGEGGEYAISNDACIETSTNSSSKININTANKEELMSLPGVGESKANDIISYREEKGDFQSIEEIMNVNGIGESIYSQIKEIIFV